MFSACLVFIGCYPRDVPRKDVEDLALTTMRCHFVIAAALVSLARAEDRVDAKLQRYLEMRQHIAAFDEQLLTEVLPQDSGVLHDIVRKRLALSVFDMEGAVELKSWDDLGQIVRKTADTCKDEGVYKAMGDIILRSQTPAKGKVFHAAQGSSNLCPVPLTPMLSANLLVHRSVRFSTMRLIINEIHALEGFDAARLSKYIRCVFQSILPLDDGLALTLLDETLQLARECRTYRQQPQPQADPHPHPHADEGDNVAPQLPAEELEWLIATSFNHAIDLYARGESHGVCHPWASKAMDLAAYMDDGEELAHLLQAKFARLRFEGKS